MKYNHYVLPLILGAVSLTLFGQQTVAAGALVASGLFAVAESLTTKAGGTNQS
jgi:hypothetical protein